MPTAFDPGAHTALSGLAPRLQELAGDASYRAGRAYLSHGAIAQGTVAGTTAYATVQGSTEYRISVAFGSELKVSCTCPAHRRNRYCKHVVAVCLGLLERPESFSLTEVAPEAAATPAAPRKRAPRRAAGPSTEELRRTGLETIERLVGELAEGGLMGMGPGQLELLANAAELVRGLKLRRLAALIQRLQQAVAHPTHAGLDEREFARLMVDLELTRCASAAYLEGSATVDPALAEELIGKTWREDELEPVHGLELMEVGFQQVIDGDFRVETSYLSDLASGALYAERQITPLRLRQTPKTRRPGRLLVDDAGLYPGPAPRRIRLGTVRRSDLSTAHVQHLVASAPDELAALRARVVERLEQPFGPAEMPVLFRPMACLVHEQQVVCLDRYGDAVPIRWPREWTDAVGRLLPPEGAYAIFGLLVDADDRLTIEAVSIVSDQLRWWQGPLFPST